VKRSQLDVFLEKSKKDNIIDDSSDDSNCTCLRRKSLLAAVFLFITFYSIPLSGKVFALPSITENREAGKVLSSRLNEQVKVYETKWFRIIASESYSKAVVEQTAPRLLDAVTDFRLLFDVKDEGFPWPGNKRGNLVFLKSRDAFKKYVDVFENEADPDKLSPGFVNAVQPAQSFYWIEPRPYAVACGEGASFKEVNQHIFHLLGHILLTWYEYNHHFPPSWLHEGYGVHMAVRYAKGNILYCTQGLNNAQFGTGVFSGLSAWARSENWPAFFRRKNRPSEISSIDDLTKLDIGSFTHTDAALSWSFVTFLIDKFPEEFRTYVRYLKDLPPTVAEECGEWTPTDYSNYVFKKSFSRTHIEMESKWREWAHTYKGDIGRGASVNGTVAAAGSVVFDPAVYLEDFTDFELKAPDDERIVEYLKKTGLLVTPEELASIKADWLLNRNAIAMDLERHLEESLTGKLAGVEKDLSRLVKLSAAQYMNKKDLLYLVRRGVSIELIRSVTITLTKKYGCSGAHAMMKNRIEKISLHGIEEEMANLEKAATAEAAIFDQFIRSGVQFQLDCWPGKVKLIAHEKGILTCTGEKLRKRLPVLSAGYKECSLEVIGDMVKVQCPMSCLKIKTFIRISRNTLKNKSEEQKTAYALFHLFRGSFAGFKKEIRSVADSDRAAIESLNAIYKKVTGGVDLLSRLCGDSSDMASEEVKKLADAIKDVIDTPLYNELKYRSKAIMRRLLFEDYIAENRFIRKFAGFKGTDLNTGAALFTYSFDNESELEDFDCSRPLLDTQLRSKYGIDRKFSDEPFHIVKGNMVAHGIDFISFRPVFAGDIEISVKFRIVPRDRDDISKGFRTLFGYGLTPEGGYIASSCLTHIEMQSSISRGFRLLESCDVKRLVDTDRDTTIKLKGDAKEINFNFNGKEEYSFPIDGRRKGQVFFWIYGERSFEISELDIKGKLDPEWLKQTAEQAVEVDLGSIFS